MNIRALVRPNIRALKPYRSARQDHLTGMLLDANENAFGSTLRADGLALNRYPDPLQQKLRARLAALNNAALDRIFVGVGSDEVIDLLMRTFCEPRVDDVVLLEPTYGMYRVAASIQDVRITSCLLDSSYQIDVARTIASVGENTKLVFCCSPNNPTGNLLRLDDIAELCRRLHALVVVDEAYIDFARNGSVASLATTYDNLVVLRTLSKAWGLAAIRLGYCLAHPTIVSLLLNVKAPYNINALTNDAAMRALDNTDVLQQNIENILRERARLMAALAVLPSVRRVFHSDANFVLVRVDDAPRVYDFLARRGIIVRNRSSEPTLENCLRITVGTPDENEALLSALRDYTA
ncbi:MAG: histidinol-phosphate transaminase [Ignavibacteriales bacterium]|nr:histidinol-phosphate transaminase [Ignavibacteriales bacterium]